MFNSGLYHQINALIGNLEEKKNRLDQELYNEKECALLSEQIENAWQALCRRNGANRRGPYARREN